MTATNAQHDTFTIERHLDASPERVFNAWAKLEVKSKWFAGGGDWTQEAREFDFRPDGIELLRGRWKTGMVTEFRSRYQDIVPDRRIVYVYEMHLDGRKISVSLATIEIEPDGKGSRLTLTEQGAFLDGYDDAGSRERGTTVQVERIVELLTTGA